ncbi:MAG: carbohydrate-binding family 9-like protein [Cyclobacteriaceae bacterium]|nr:carbohydrate-binding family 9-like protein [Cyclobacteriaceae bacterium]
MMRTVLIAFMIMISYHSLDAQKKKTNYIKKIPAPLTIDADWEKAPWNKIEAISLEHYMGERPEHFPKVQVKAAYDDQCIYLIWKVNDQYVRAVAEKHQDPVYKDSCVEFFFSTHNTEDRSYFNLEMNCGGTMLFNHHGTPGDQVTKLPDHDMEQVKIAHTMPKMVPTEITDTVTWYLEYAIPFAMLNKYQEFETPTSGTVWQGNFYKIADDTSHPHWLTWSQVVFPKPRFHMPEFFGKLVFE